ncbi:MAG: hypothetical protein WC357_07490 [Candidatus Omnitrophota bacterium]|jgi:hypothetical protein
MLRLSKIILLALFVFVFFAPAIFAEDITITTYYPSPYGSYNELQLYPHTPAITTCDATHGVGTMFYDSSTNEIKVCHGSAGWLTLNSGISYTYYCFNLSLGTPVCSNAGGTQGYCPSGYKQKLALGSWGACGNVGYHYFLPPGGTCDAYPTSIAGQAYVCSQ